MRDALSRRVVRVVIGSRSLLVLSTTEGLIEHWLLPRVAKLRQLNGRLNLEVISSLQQQSIATNDLDFVIRMGDPGENELVGKRVATAAFGIFASERYLATHRPLRSLDDMQDHDIIGHTSDFSGFQSERRGQLPLFTQFSAAAAKRSVLRVTPLANHFAAAAHDLGLAFLAVPFALAEGLVRVLPQENATLNVWLLRRKESDLRKLTKEVRRFLEGEFANSQEWLAGETQLRKASRRKP
ncbi:LysR family transcriptional regulator (plasmid) [Bradyrhizobium sp. 186]|nr:LysR family transcriptional regulator [Bradyrhizobium sp. 186]